MLRNSWEANILLVGKKEIKEVTLVIEIKGVSGKKIVQKAKQNETVVFKLCDSLGMLI